MEFTYSLMGIYGLLCSLLALSHFVILLKFEWWLKYHDNEYFKFVKSWAVGFMLTIGLFLFEWFCLGGAK